MYNAWSTIKIHSVQPYIMTHDIYIVSLCCIFLLVFVIPAVFFSFKLHIAVSHFISHGSIPIKQQTSAPICQYQYLLPLLVFCRDCFWVSLKRSFGSTIPIYNDQHMGAHAKSHWKLFSFFFHALCVDDSLVSYVGNPHSGISFLKSRKKHHSEY